MMDKLQQGDIAIIGMAGKFPESDNIDEMWRNIVQGKDCINRAADLITQESGYDYVRAFGSLGGIQNFDRNLFGVSEPEAGKIDPQERLLLQLAHAALEDAGCDYTSYGGRVGIICGSYDNEQYFMERFANEKQEAHWDTTISEILYSGTALATRIAYKFNFKGPSLILDTACSTSLVAVNYAVSILQKGEADIMLVGGSNIYPEQEGYVLVDGMTSADGKVRAFDENGSGMIPANGGGVVVLKRLEDAEADRDHIYAVIKGSAVNNDGSRKIGFTAPSVEGQVEVIDAALRSAGIPKSAINYIETHGTATPLGDAIEIRALNRVYGIEGNSDPIAIGSLKSNFGHLNIAAGIAGLIKSTLVLKYKQIPPSINIGTANKELSNESPIYVERAGRMLNDTEGKLYAGVSSFGIGGNNAHVILESYHNENNVTASGRYLLPFSANDEEALERLSVEMKEFVKTNLHNLPSISYTLVSGRRRFSHRDYIIADESGVMESGEPRSAEYDELYLCFEDNDYDNENLTDLYEGNPVFAKVFDQIINSYNQILNKEITRADLQGEENSDIRKFAFSYSLGKILLESGIEPDKMIGSNTYRPVIQALTGIKTLDEALVDFNVSGAVPDSASLDKPESERSDILQIKLKAVDSLGFLRILGTLWVHGFDPDLKLFTGGNAQKMSIPTYPFALTDCSGSVKAEKNNNEIEVYEPVWEQRVLLKSGKIPDLKFVCLAQDNSLLGAYQEELTEHNMDRASTIDELEQKIKQMPGRKVIIIQGECWIAELEQRLPAYSAEDSVEKIIFVYQAGEGGFLPAIEHDAICLSEYFNRRTRVKKFKALGLERFDRRVLDEAVYGRNDEIVAYFAGMRFIMNQVSVPVETSDIEIDFVSLDERVTAYMESVRPEGYRLISGNLTSDEGMIITPELVKEIKAIEVATDQQEDIASIYNIDCLSDVYDELCAVGAEYYISQGRFDAGLEYTVDDILSRLNVVGDYKHFAVFLLDILVRAGRAERTDCGYILSGHMSREKYEQCIREAVAREPQFEAYIMLFKHCVDHYYEAFSGKIPGNSVIYPDGNFDMLNQVEKQLPNTSRLDTYITICKKIYRHIISSGSDMVRILEIGGGTGRLSWPLLEYLRDLDIEYYFTDIGNSFLAEARKEAEKRNLHNIKFCNFNLERDHREQQMADCMFDCIVGIEVIQATSNVDNVLQRLYRMLKTNGIISMIQTFKEPDMVQMIFGYAPGYWNFNKDSRRAGKGMNMDARQWKAAYQEAGFSNIAVFDEGYRADRDDVGIIMANKISEEELKTVKLNTVADMLSRECILAIDPAYEVKNYGNEQVLETIKEIIRSVKERRISAFSLLVPEATTIETVKIYSRLYSLLRSYAESGWCSWKIGIYDNFNSEIFEHLKGKSGRPFVVLESGMEVPDSEVHDESQGENHKLIECISEILGLENVDEEENLFELGFDSLSILSLKSKIRSGFNCEVSVNDFYIYETIRELNEHIQKGTQEEPKESVDVINEQQQDISDLLDGLI